MRKSRSALLAVAGGTALVGSLLYLAHRQRGKVQEPTSEKDSDIERFRRNAHRLVDIIADAGYHELSAVEAQSQSIYEILGDLEQGRGEWTELQKKLELILRLDAEKNKSASVEFSNESSITHHAALADIAASGFNATGSALSDEAMQEIEAAVVIWLQKLFALDNFHGVLVESAIESMMFCINIAKERILSDLDEPLRRTVTEKLVAYIPDHCWQVVEPVLAQRRESPCVFKIIGTSGDSNHRLSAQKLDDQIAKDVDAGLVPFFVVASYGGGPAAFCDDIPLISQIAREHDVWLHVDATAGGVSSICDEYQSEWHQISAEPASISIGLSHFVAVGASQNSIVFISDDRVPSDHIFLPLREARRGVGAVAIRSWFGMFLSGIEHVMARVRQVERFGLIIQSEIAAAGIFSVVGPCRFGVINFEFGNIAARVALAEVANDIISPVWVGENFLLQIYCGRPNLTEETLRSGWRRIEAHARDILSK